MFEYFILVYFFSYQVTYVIKDDFERFVIRNLGDFAV